MDTDNKNTGYTEGSDVYDLVGQAGQRQETERLQAHAAAQAARDREAVMSTPEGRRFVSRILEGAGLFRISFVAERNETDFREGNRNVALKLWAELEETCPHLVDQMRKELRK